MPSDAITSNIAISPCCHPRLPYEQALTAYADLGYRKFELFTSWATAAVDWQSPPATVRAPAERCGMTFSSLHLPAIRGDAVEEGVADAVAATRFAADLHAPVVLFKADTRETYIEAAGAYLNAIEGLPVRPVLQNHAGTAISTLDDFRMVLDGINDARMHALLEVGHFHAVGVSWREGYELLKGRLALVHIKDMLGKQSVPFGSGEVDLPGLFTQLTADGYAGDYVVEMEVQDEENTLVYLAQAREYLRNIEGARL